MYKMNLKFYWNYFHLMSMYTVSNNKCIQINKCMKHWHYIYMPIEGYAICILQTYNIYNKCIQDVCTLAYIYMQIKRYNAF